ncbi:MAG: hypothetical protein ACKOXF_00860 [Chitinophagaceae bacterium]
MKKNLPYAIILLIVVFCFLFPNNNTTIDSWYYAACVRHHYDLFNNSHHLLYNFFGYNFHQFLNVFSPVSALKSLQLLNTSASAISLFLFYHILKLIGCSLKNAAIITAFCASGFGFLRFATDAETYILPLMWTFLSAYFYIKSDKLLHTSLASFFAVIAVCTHQLQIWWTLALFIHICFLSKRTLKSRIVFSAILLLIPLIYFQTYVICRFCNVSFIGFIYGQYNSGGAGIDISFKALLLTFVNFFRTFLQVHGQLIYLAKKYPVTTIIVLIILLKMLVFLFLKRREILKFQNKERPGNYSFLFLLTFIFNLLFAFVSSGNAEFMVMLPFMLTAYIASNYNLIIYTRSLIIILFMLVWNLSTGILPSTFENISKTDLQADIYMQHPDAFFVFENKAQVENQVCYTTNFEFTNRFISADQIRLYLDSGKIVYTDLGLKTTEFSRASFLKKDDQNDLLKNYNLTKTDSFQNLYGKNYIYLISKKDE